MTGLLLIGILIVGSVLRMAPALDIDAPREWEERS